MDVLHTLDLAHTEREDIERYIAELEAKRLEALNDKKRPGRQRGIEDELAAPKDALATLASERVPSVRKDTGSAEGTALHLQVKIGETDCYIYQGTFTKNGVNYRYQMAVPVEDAPSNEELKSKIQERIQNAIKSGDTAHLSLCVDSADGWKAPLDKDAMNGLCIGSEDTHEMTFTEGNQFTAEPTLVIGLPGVEETEITGAVKAERGSQYVACDRYYVSDYDVYAIAHTVPPGTTATQGTGAAPETSTAEARNEALNP